MITLEQLNRMSVDEFVAALGGIFEHSPWVAQRAAAARPFISREDLHAAMCSAVAAATADEQLALIRAHPELAGRAAIRNELTQHSIREQRGAKLDECSAEEFAQLQTMNAAYNARFGFPFVLAVRGHDRQSILAAFAQRLQHEVDHERTTALRQIERIAAFRLADTISAPLGAQIMAMHEQLARFSDDENNLTCAYLTAAHRATAAAIRDYMLGAGLDTHIDAVGNVVGRWRSGIAGAKTLITGSHYDTVIDAGKYDGRLGILLPIVVALDLRQRGLHLPFDLEIIAFAEEEGVRFKSTFLGSSAVAGSFDARVLDSIDADGVTMREAMREAGFDTDAIKDIARDPATLAGYVEVHIEQGPVLLDANRALGVVTSIAGSVRKLVSIRGVAGHAGTVPMPLRRDAAAAAAEIVLAVERRCAIAPGLVGTVGRLHVPNGAINVIPGECELSIDIRADEDALRDAAVADVLAQIEQIGARRQVQINIRRVLEAACAPCAPTLQSQWSAAIARITGDNKPLHLPSGAGHDAMKMASICAIGMLFVRCGNGGISHNPLETLSADDADIAARVFSDFLLHFKADT
ncbi:2-oxo-4-hydroxy-4-carboxy-5-ureidoimidazoline decarboxylase [Pseudolysobacter antarcticus]|uniref:2-oxo-4-hydroxy-4-carboxy-5-ureidoimidazoline decarboxylase n=1 Tax=Pseudolysobacter antarcticus TaxID=2511995 RepID=A0A411HIY5_9GAMM|nr:2-oxo-4-hydroxy-4-carboxy-5-ureidoimidazoline decarboxylase [Pseudolysobacter antarcticus]QBB70441.1 2-oxo-4-hydroxy-4-carboxy-5-ureidoimidazoline decarboxylase [Pseudolysobacter antarcticus]